MNMPTHSFYSTVLEVLATTIRKKNNSNCKDIILSLFADETIYT